MQTVSAQSKAGDTTYLPIQAKASSKPPSAPVSLARIPLQNLIER